MTCAEVEQKLVAYQFNAIGDDARDDLEAHLVECSSCVRTYVSIKRAVETSNDSRAVSAAARERLRRAVARELGIGASRRAWWERPLAVAVAASFVLLAGATTHVLTTSAGSPPRAMGTAAP